MVKMKDSVDECCQHYNLFKKLYLIVGRENDICALTCLWKVTIIEQFVKVGGFQLLKIVV